MQNLVEKTRSDDDALLAGVWRTLAGLLVAAGVIYGGTLLIEAVLPALPDQAHANTARSYGASSLAFASPAGPYAATPVEHFHAQFRLQPGRDVEAHVEAF